MLLRNVTSPSTWIGAGQLFLVMGILGQRLVNPEAHFWAGFADGLFMAFIGASIVFNLRGLVLQRRQRETG